MPDQTIHLDSYLEPWTRYESPANLRAAFTLAQPLAAVCGALGWQPVVSSLAEPFKEQYAEPVPSLHAGHWPHDST